MKKTKRIPSTQFRANLHTYINYVLHRDFEFIITCNGVDKVRIVSLEGEDVRNKV